MEGKEVHRENQENISTSPGEAKEISREIQGSA